MDYEILNLASIHKTAEIITSAFGEPYENTRKLAAEEFTKTFNMDRFNVDKNANARLDLGEKSLSKSIMSR